GHRARPRLRPSQRADADRRAAHLCDRGHRQYALARPRRLGRGDPRGGAHRGPGRATAQLRPGPLVHLLRSGGGERRADGGEGEGARPRRGGRQVPALGARQGGDPRPAGGLRQGRPRDQVRRGSGRSHHRRARDRPDRRGLRRAPARGHRRGAVPHHARAPDALGSRHGSGARGPRPGDPLLDPGRSERMATTGKSLGSLHPAVAPAEKLAKTTLPRERQLELYRLMRLTRMVEGRLGNLYRQGKVVGGLYTSLGQEATAVGSACALEPQDVIGPLIRNLGSMLVLGGQPREVMMQYMARGLSPTGGKDGNTHFGDLKRGIVAPISMLGAVIPVMAGVALAGRMRGLNLVALTYIGDGGTSTGDFHEGLNLAAVLDAPFVLIAENNGYAYSTPTSQQMKIKNIVLRAAGYGIPGEM